MLNILLTTPIIEEEFDAIMEIVLKIDLIIERETAKAGTKRRAGCTRLQ